MDRLSPQVLVQLTRRVVRLELRGKRTALHAPPLPDGVVTDDPLAECATLDVRLLQQLGYRAFYNEDAGVSAWPVPLGMSPQELAMFSEERGVLYAAPRRGDIFLQRGLRPRQFIHAGLVMTVDGQGFDNGEVAYFDTSTVEGDTDHRGLLHAGYTCKLRRRLSPRRGDRFLRWSELEPLQAEAA